jgi:uroporphyrinogen-III synthase
MTSLRGVGVLVTRPELQVMPLCRLLEAQGAVAVRFPAMKIEPLGNRHELILRLGKLDTFDLVIFTSANAVRFGASLLAQEHGLTLAAMGPATARALQRSGYDVSIMPSRSFDSENLLEHPKLERLARQRVLLIKGSGGREYLQQQLTERGAQVVIADVYKRGPATPTAADLEGLEATVKAGTIHVITATSLEIAANLLELATPTLRNGFNHLHWVVPGTRVARGVRELGVAAPLLEADSADDQDLVAAIVRWRRDASGA